MMLFPGDLTRLEETAVKAERIRAGLAVLEGMPPGIERHAEIVELLIEMGELEQGLLDDQLLALGRERPTPMVQNAAAVTRALAETLFWSFRFVGLPPAWEGKGLSPTMVGVSAALRALRRLSAMRLPSEVAVVVPEGYASRGLYPETFLRAGERLRDEWKGVLRVIGVRGPGGTGTSLAAAVAAGGRGEASATVRPEGDPFAPSLPIGARMTGRLLTAADAPGWRRPLFAIVDEGPGRWGNAFGAMADWLAEQGVPPDSIVLVPGQAGPLGPPATEDQQRQWEAARKFTVGFEELFLAADSPWPVARWVEDLTGPADGPVEDIGAGRWRDQLFPAGTERSSTFAPAFAPDERRKLLLTSKGKTWLLRFAGLGRYGRESLEIATELDKAGLIPPVAGLRHGFLVGPWLDRARPLPLVEDLDRELLLDQVARYISFRARRLPAGDRPGASPESLLSRALSEADAVLGVRESAALGDWRERLPELSALARPVLTDNRMQAWEWLVTPEGKLLKTDALDHHRYLQNGVGVQDPAWDLAGAIVELGLSEDEQGKLVEKVERSRRIKTPAAQLRFYLQMYTAIQAGWSARAAESLKAADEAFASDAERMGKQAEGYAERLRMELRR